MLLYVSICLSSWLSSFPSFGFSARTQLEKVGGEGRGMRDRVAGECLLT